MSDKHKTKAQLLGELDELRGHIAMLEAAGNKNETEWKYRTMFEASTDAIFVETLDGRVLDCNTTAGKMFGYTKQEFLQLSVTDLIPPEVVAKLPELISEGLATGSVFFQTVNMRKNGEVFPVEVSTQIVSIEGQPGAIVYVRDITERERNTLALARRMQELTAAYETALEISSQGDLSKLLPMIVERAANLIGAPMGGLYLVRPDGETLELVVSHRMPRDFTEAILRMGKGLSGQVAQTGEMIIIEDYQAWEGRADIFEGVPFRRVLGVPLKIEDRVIGVIKIIDIEMKGPYSEQEIQSVTMLANQAAMAVHNAQLHAEVQAELAERQRAEKVQSTLYRISEATQTAGDLGELYQLIHEIISEMMPAKDFYIALYDAATNLLTFPYHADQFDVVWNAIEPGKTLTGYVLRTGMPQLVTPEIFDQLEAKGEVESFGTPSVDWLGVPLKIQGETIGVMATQSYTETVRLTKTDLDLLVFISSPVAMAIMRKRAEDALRDREESYRLLFENAPVGIFSADSQGNILEVNPKALQILGSPSPAATKAISLLTFPPLVEAGISTDFQHCFETGQPVFADHLYITKWGKSIHAQYYLAPIQGPDGKVALVQTILEDITERKKVEERIRRLNRTLQVISGVNQALVRATDEGELMAQTCQILVNMGGYRTAWIGLTDEDKDQNVRPVAAAGDDADSFTEANIAWADIVAGRDYALSIALPLMASDEEPFGSIYLYATDPEAFDEDEIELLSEMVDDLAFGILTLRARAERQKLARALQESEERYRTMVENIPIAIYRNTPGPSGQYLMVNPAMVSMFGFESEEQLLQTPVADLYIDPERRNVFSERLLQRGSLVGEEILMKRRNGEPLWGSVTAQVIRDETTGEVAYFDCAMKDITESRLAEEALRESEEKYRNVVERANDGIVIIQDDVIKFCNNSLAKLWGGPVDEILGTPFINYIAPVAQAKSAEYYRRRIAGERVPTIYETLLARKDGGLVDAELNAGIIMYEGKPADLVVLRDISERKQAEEEIRRLNQDLGRRAEQLALLYEAGLTLNRTLDLHEQMESLATIAMQALRADHGGYFRYDAADRHVHYEFGVGRGSEIESLRSLEARVGEERGLIGWVAEKRQPLYLQNVKSDPRWVVTDPELNSALWVPIEREDELLGLLSVASIRKNAFTEADQQLLVLLANQVAVSMVNARLYEAAIEAAERRTTLHWLSQEIVGRSEHRHGAEYGNADLEAERIYNAIYQAACKLMPVEAFVIAVMYDPSSDTIEVPFCIDQGERFPGGPIDRVTGLSGKVVNSGKMIYIKDLEKEEENLSGLHFGQPLSVHSVLAVPMRVGDRVLGMLSAQSYKISAYTDEDARLLEILAAYAAIALENAHMFARMRTSNIELANAYEATIEGWSRALEMRDKETKGHSERVSRIALRLGRELGLSGEAMEQLRRGVLLHDIGKMAVPDYILLKPGPLSEDEWRVMRQHPTFAHQMISGIPFLAPALDVPYCHHENWDGTGYPRNLRGEDIPLRARIFALVDVWDALTSDRPYRPAWKPDAARSYIAAQSGIRFDPKLANVFLKLLDTGEI
jgi:PAS domain S-box-containing protein